jgi:hypothetical protein
MVDTTKRGLGKNYFKYCIRPDQHSIEILRGFKDLLAGKVDFFSTIYWGTSAPIGF